MGDLLLALDGAYGLLFLVAAVLAALESPRDLDRAKQLVRIGAAIFAIRWGLWALTTDVRWPIRATAAVVVCVTFFGLVPAALKWIDARSIKSKIAATHEQSGRTYIDLSPKQITNMVSKLTSVHAEGILTHYKSKWVSIRIRVENVHAGYPQGYQVIGYDDIGILPYAIRDKVMFSMRSAQKWTDKIVILGKGAQIYVEGQLDDVSYNTINLINCEML